MTNKTLEQQIAELLKVTKRLNQDEANHYLENMKIGLQEALKALKFAQAELAKVKEENEKVKSDEVLEAMEELRDFLDYLQEGTLSEVQDKKNTLGISLFTKAQNLLNALDKQQV